MSFTWKLVNVNGQCQCRSLVMLIKWSMHDLAIAVPCAFIRKLLSKITPMFLAFFEIGITLSAMSILWMSMSFWRLESVITINSVFESFGLSMLVVIHFLMFNVQYLIFDNILSKSSWAFVINATCNCPSSGNIWYSKPCRRMMSPRGLVYTLYSSAPIRDLWGAPNPE